MLQGQVLSVLNSNLLCNAELGQWSAKDGTCKIENGKGYSFASKDAEDVLHERNVILHKKSYSDGSTLIIHDNNHLTIRARIIQNYGAHNTTCQREERRQQLTTILRSAEAAVKRTRFVLVVCKIPRSGMKSLVWIIKVHPDDANLVPNQSSPSNTHGHRQSHERWTSQ